MNKLIQICLMAFVTLLLSTTSASALDVNKASVEELQQVKGIGPVIAERIVKERRKGRFQSMADLQDRVTGVGPEIAKNLGKGSTLPTGKKAASKPAGKSKQAAKTAKGKVTETAAASKGVAKSKTAAKTKTAASKAKTKQKVKKKAKKAPAEKKS